MSPEASRDQPGATPRTGTAVPRPPGQRPHVGDDDDHDHGHGVPAWGYYYPRYYYPYGYGAFGLGYFYYDPFYWGAFALTGRMN